jgi:ArsR family transcriptional regulator, arsenate/arsenite/antimonite-responsive transcriptional repressor
MARDHSHLFTNEDAAVARLCKALAHPARVMIVRILAEAPSCTCGEIVDLLPLSQATVSQHLRELRDAGVIKGTEEGARMCYCLNIDGWMQARDLFTRLATLEPCC